MHCSGGAAACTWTPLAFVEWIPRDGTGAGYVMVILGNGTGAGIQVANAANLLPESAPSTLVRRHANVLFGDVVF